MLVLGVVCFYAPVVLALLWLRRRATAAPQHRTFSYGYQRHPFDDRQVFTVRADSQAAADEIATKQFEAMFRARQTVMTVFYPVVA